MRTHGEPTSYAELSTVVDALRATTSLIPALDRSDCVSTELFCVDRALCRVRSQGLARGPVFCDWGSGLGGVCIVAALNGFELCGIEIDPGLVTAAKSLTADFDLPISFVAGSFLQPGDETLGTDPRLRTRLVFDA
jgi:predicted RNA methylase